MHWLIKTASFLPEKCLTNYDLEANVKNTSHEWIVQMVGIHTRHICSDSENVLSMALKVISRMNLNEKEISEIKIIIVATSTNRRFIPSIASSIHRKLGCQKYVITFDLNDACNGFVQSISVAYQYVKDGGYALVIGVDHMSSITNWHDRNTCILFADGAGAVLLDGSKINKFHHTSYTLSEYNDDLFYNGEYIKMNGNVVFLQAVTNLASDIIKICNNASLSPDDIDHYLLHQANKRILEKVATSVCEQSGHKIEKKFVNIIKNMGNTSAATIPIAMNYIEKDIKTGKKRILLSGFAAGLRGGSVIIE